MCKALLSKVLRKLSPREHNHSVKSDILEKEIKKENYKMEEEKIVNKEEKKEETQIEKESSNKQDETKEVPNVEDKDAPKKEEEIKEEVKEEECKSCEQDVEKEEESDENPKVEEIEEVKPNAIRVEDIVTKADLQEILSAFNAKLDAIIKENQDLKDANSKMHEKYEVGDFGNEIKNGTMNVKPASQYQSFDEYSKQFM